MTEIRHLSHAPISEAVVDLRVRLRDGFDVNTFGSLPSSVLAKDYPTSEKQHLLESQLQFAPGGPPQSAARDLGVSGYRFTSENRTAVVQFRLDGFTFSRLSPYTDRNDVVKEARRLWNHYIAIAPIENVVRLAVRYINNFAIPTGRTPAEYLAVPPTTPAGLPDGVIKGALSRVVALDSATEATCLVTQVIDVPGDAGTNVVMDIDVYLVGNFECGGEPVWKAFEQLRDVKNRIFFGSITETAAKAFE